MRSLRDLPLLVVLVAVAGVAMLVPAFHALTLGKAEIAAIFAKSGFLTVTAAAVMAAATMGYRPRNVGRSQILSLVGAYAVLPPILAWPMVQAMPQLTFAQAWFEMVSSLTTTGASILPPGVRTPQPVHLWNALVGWLGGLLVLVAASAVLAPLNLGGLEVANPRPVGRPAFAASPIHGTADAAQRLWLSVRVLVPGYAVLTLALWVGLLLAGQTGLPAIAHAMGTLSTSGISPVGGLERAGSGWVGEALILLFLVFSVSRAAFPGGLPLDRSRALWRDEELRIAVVLVLGLAALLTLRHWIAASAEGEAEGLVTALRTFWARVFTLASFLTTTGYVAGDWGWAFGWSGLGPPALLLAGLALIGGGVATTAGGIKLLRIHALYRQGRHEVERLIDPALVAGGGERARHLRGDGAYLAWLAFMLFLLSLSVGVAALALMGLRFETALVLTISALSTTGPLALAAGAPDFAWVRLGDGPRAVLAVVMVLGRLELLAIIALLVPEGWRR
ncbi:MAG: potassium transporter TrkG [Alkalilacustris sp.]